LLGFFFYFVPWELPPSLKSADFSNSFSRANVAQLIKSKKVEVGEIYGLLHLVTGDNEQEHVLSNVHLDPTVSVEMSVYAAGDTSIDWEKEKETIDKNYPIVVFSKVC
jgi:aromatic ring-cleaving dioxygenase